MAGFGTTPVTTGAPVGTPLGSVAVEGHAGGNLTALRGWTARNDSNGNETAAVGAYIENVVALGQALMVSSSPVTWASDQTPLVSATATRSNVAGAAADTSLLASNGSRKGALFYNDSTAILYLAYGATAASTTSYSMQIPANGFFELPPQPIFTGAIRGIWSSALGNVRITELS